MCTNMFPGIVIRRQFVERRIRADENNNGLSIETIHEVSAR